MTPKFSNLSKKIFLRIPSLTLLYSCPELVSLGQLHSASGLAGPFSPSLSLSLHVALPAPMGYIGLPSMVGGSFPRGKAPVHICRCPLVKASHTANSRLWLMSTPGSRSLGPLIKQLNNTRRQFIESLKHFAYLYHLAYWQPGELGAFGYILQIQNCG